MIDAIKYSMNFLFIFKINRGGYMVVKINFKN